jgi:preprotein translocase subunit SecD
MNPVGACHLDEALVVDIRAHPARAVIDRIEWVFAISVFEQLLRRAGGNAFGRPLEILHRIDAGGDVAVRQQQAEDRLRVEGDVGIDPEQVSELLRQELHHHLVATARDQAFAVEMQDAGQAEMRAIQRQAEDAGDIIHGDRGDVTGSREHHAHRLQSRDRQHMVVLGGGERWRERP